MSYFILIAFSFESMKKISNFDTDLWTDLYIKRMEDLKMNNDAVFNDKEIIFSKAIKAGKRIYYLDVKRNRKDELFLAITESKKTVTGEGENARVSFEKHKIFLYKEDFDKFSQGFQEALSYIEDKQGKHDPSGVDYGTNANQDGEKLMVDSELGGNEIKIDIDFE